MNIPIESEYSERINSNRDDIVKNSRATIKLLLAGFTIALLVGCSVQPISRVAADMMPPDRAKALFKKLGYEEWAAKPYLISESACGAEKIDVAVSEIHNASASLRKATLLVSASRRGVCSVTYSFRINDVIDAKELVRAINALGGTIDNLIVND